MEKNGLKSFSKAMEGIGNEVNTKNKINKGKKRFAGIRFSRLVDWLIMFPLYLVVILLPMFFYQNVPSPLELNKQILLVVLVGISALAWIGKMAWKNEMRFRKSFLLIPVAVFLLMYGLSTVYSSYYEQSMWGYFGGEYNAFVTILFLATFFVLIFNNIKNYQGVVKLLSSFLLGGFLLALFSILQFFEIYLLSLEFTKVKSFTPVGSIYVSSIYIASVFLVSVTLFLSSVSKWIKLFLVSLSVATFFLLMIINFKIIWIVLLIMLAFILGVTILVENKKPSQLRILPMIFLVFVLLFLLRGKPLFNNFELPVEVFLKYKTATKISLNSIKDSPMLGSGPTTFANVYKKNRPSGLGDFSVVNFNESTSFFLTLASTTGLLGIASFLFLVGAGLTVLFKEIVGIILSSSKEQKNNFYNFLGISIGVGWLFLTLMLFLYFANITILMLWWLFLALLLVTSFLSKGEKDAKSNEIATASSGPKTSFFLSFGFVLVIIGFVAVIYLQGQKYIAAVYFTQALTIDAEVDGTQKVAEKISRAVSLDPNRDSYFRDLAVVHLALAKEKIVEKGLQNLTPEESNFVSARFRSALQSLNQAKVLNPSDSLNLVSVAKLYEEFIIIQKDSADKAVDNYREAIELDPKNPELYQAIANVQVTLADLDLLAQTPAQGSERQLSQEGREYLAMAEEHLKKALVIKPEHVGANVSLVSVYERQGATENAINKSKENLGIYPNSAELHMDLGRIYYQQENYDEAVVYLNKALALSPQYSNARYLLALVLEKQNDTEGALREFEKIQETNLNNELLEKIIDNLKNGRTALSEVDGDEPVLEAEELAPSEEGIGEEEVLEETLINGRLE